MGWRFSICLFQFTWVGVRISDFPHFRLLAVDQIIRSSIALEASIAEMGKR